MRSTILFALLCCLSVPLAAQSTGCAFETIFTGGADDAFALPADPVHLSPALGGYIFVRNPKTYDDTAIDRHFGDSFKVDQCLICSQICSAEIEIELQGSGGLDCNDTLFIGQAGGMAVYADTIHPGGCVAEVPDDIMERWKQSVTTSSVRTINLDVKTLQDLVCDLNYPWLDVIVQDDHAVDSIRLIVRY